MECGKLKRHGGLLIEVIISIFIFTIGILALTSTMLYSLKIVAQSRGVTVSEQGLINNAEIDLLNMTVEHDINFSPSGTSIASDIILMNKNDSSKTLLFNLYRYKLDNKKGSAMYVIKRRVSP